MSFANELFQEQLGLHQSPDHVGEILDILKALPENFPGEALKVEMDFVARNQKTRRAIVRSSGWRNTSETEPSIAMISIGDVADMVELQRENAQISRLNHELSDSLTKLHEAQDEIIRKGRLEQLGKLIATVAHELRNPLGSVRTSAYLLQRKLGERVGEVMPQLNRISNGIVRCDNIITQLLDYSRSQQVVENRQDLDGWLAKVMEEQAQRLPQNLEVVLELGLQGQLVSFDSDRLMRAIINLVSNAAEAMIDKDGRPLLSMKAPPRLRVSTSRVGEHAAIVVADNGPGMTPEVLSRIREPLFTTKNFGTGLGIPAVEQIALQHGGKLDIWSAPGEGAVFTIKLPLPVDTFPGAVNKVLN